MRCWVEQFESLAREKGTKRGQKSANHFCFSRDSSRPDTGLQLPECTAAQGVPARGPMKLDSSSRLACSPAQKEGYLLKKGSRHASYHRRWFLLCGNLLLYWERQGDPQPLGLILLEGSSVTLRNSKLEFAFSICSVSRVYKMAAESQKDLELWVRALLSANLGYTKALLGELRGQYLGLTQSHTERTSKQAGAYAPEEPEWEAEFGHLHQWLGKEIQSLKKINLIDFS
ncbi:sesquipedalian-1-like [Pyxicephalus adspersus]|uniref:sesquipedalian-1-like n=1 Tax=Pyxicephalus adspersus TaxID=30357 RepID=UPI003B5B4305